jgi:hypothetical protein
VFYWLSACKCEFKANNHGLNSHLYIILVFLFKYGMHDNNGNRGTKKLALLYSRET